MVGVAVLQVAEDAYAAVGAETHGGGQIAIGIVNVRGGTGGIN